MSYNPMEYWRKRKEPNSDIEVPGIVENYIQEHLTGETILDYGVGRGRLLYLYKGYSVTGVDLVSTYRSDCLVEAEAQEVDFTHKVTGLLSLKGPYDTVIASKVLLHVLPKNIKKTVDRLRTVGERLIVWDAIDQNAPHVFDHNYRDYGQMKDVQQWDNQLLFFYG